jgi:WS/DGAT/MGAT family acyltransferase
MANERYREMLAKKKAMREESATPRELRNMGQAFKAQFGSSLQLGKSLGRVANAWLGREDALQVSWRNVPHTPINTEVDSARRFVAQSWPFARIRNMGKALGGSFNDAVLAMCAGALRTQLLSQGDIPEQSLKALVPISLREMGDMDSSNAVGAIIADMATNIADPVKRFKAIKASMEAGKSLYKGMGSRDAMLFTGLTQAPALLMLPLGLASRFPPFSLVISNVPGSRQPMYWNGAKVEGIYPANILINGIALNITLVTYDDQVDFGITACRRSLPQAQRLIDYMEDSLVELEQAAGELSSGTHKSQGRVVKRKVGAPARKAAVSATAAKVRPKAKRTVKLKARAKAAPQLAGKAASKARAKVPAKAKAATKAKAPAKAKASAAKVGVEKGAEAPVAEVKA